MVDIRAVETLKRPVALDAIKVDPHLTKMALVTNSRLSAQPVSSVEWNIIRAEGALLWTSHGSGRKPRLVGAGRSDEGHRGY
jgi:hypothetical protein